MTKNNVASQFSNYFGANYQYLPIQYSYDGEKESIALEQNSQVAQAKEQQTDWQASKACSVEAPDVEQGDLPAAVERRLLAFD
jgi:hypothetical protein